MALIVEDGTGLATADSYLSLADANIYFTNHGSPVEWTGAADAAKESALRYAARWLDGKFTWIGLLVQGTQSLEWPRIQGLAYKDTIDWEGRVYDPVPQKVKDAQCEVALAHLKNFPLNQ